MSVAFRRESDEAHLEPRFDRPIPPGPNLVTARGLAQIGAEVASLEAQVAAEDSPERRTELERDLRYWRARQATAQLAPAPPADTIAFGSRVRIRLDGVEQLVALVGADEAEPQAGRIAFTAPLARALIGAGEGDLLPFAGREDAIEIVELLPPHGD